MKTVTTNGDGRTDRPLIGEGDLEAGDYELIFDLGSYFDEAAFLDQVPIHFRVSQPDENYHVPLLCSPWSYSTYRGS